MDSSFASKQTRKGIIARWRQAVALAMTDEVIENFGSDRSLAKRACTPSDGRKCCSATVRASRSLGWEKLGVHHEAVQRRVEMALA
jgi:hypothetical protein